MKDLDKLKIKIETDESMSNYEKTLLLIKLSELQVNFERNEILNSTNQSLYNIDQNLETLVEEVRDIYNILDEITDESGELM